MPKIEFSFDGIVTGYKKSWWIVKLFTNKAYYGIQIKVNEEAYKKCLRLKRFYIRRIRIPKNSSESKTIIFNPESDNPHINYQEEYPLNSKVTIDQWYEEDNLCW